MARGGGYRGGGFPGGGGMGNIQQLMRRPQTIAYLLQLDFWLQHYCVEFCF